MDSPIQYVSLPYPYTTIETIHPDIFEEWIRQYSPETQKILRDKWKKGRKWMNKQTKGNK